MFKKQQEIRRQEMISLVNNILPIDASLISLECKTRLFDEDFRIEIKRTDNKYIFHTVKGNIFYNNKLYCDSSYHYFEKDSTFSKLLNIIKNILN